MIVWYFLLWLNLWPVAKPKKGNRMSLRSVLGISRIVTDRVEAVRLFEKLRLEFPQANYERDLARLRRGDTFRLEVWNRGKNNILELWGPGDIPATWWDRLHDRVHQAQQRVRDYFMERIENPVNRHESL